MMTRFGACPGYGGISPRSTNAHAAVSRADDLGMSDSSRPTVNDSSLDAGEQDGDVDGIRAGHRHLLLNLIQP